MNKVSLWIARFNSKEKLNDYIREEFDKNGDMYSNFMKSFKIDFIDNHFQEIDFYNNSKLKQEIFDAFSYVQSFIHLIPNENWENYNAVILLYNYEYHGKVKQNKQVKFIGTFNYIED